MYVGPGEGGDQLWVRDRDRLDATPLPGTLGAISPWFSPDGQRIAFSAGANFDLKIVPVTGGPPITLATPGERRGWRRGLGPRRLDLLRRAPRPQSDPGRWWDA